MWGGTETADVQWTVRAVSEPSARPGKHDAAGAATGSRGIARGLEQRTVRHELKQYSLHLENMQCVPNKVVYVWLNFQ
jgi:hypothetical protein